MALRTLTPDSDLLVSYQNATGVNWSTIRTSAGTNNAASPLRAAFRRRTPPNFLSGDRSVIVFDTSFLNGREVLSATLRVYGNEKNDDYSNSPKLNVYTHTPGDIDNLATSDYNIATHGSTKLCDTDITYAGFDTSGWNEFVLNSTGLAHIQTNAKTAFSFREVTYDVGNTTPTVAATTETYQGFAFDADSQTNPPELIIEYPSTAGMFLVF